MSNSNPWAALLGPVEPPTICESAAPRRVHVMADDADPMTPEPSRRPWAYQPQNALEPSCIMGVATIRYECAASVAWAQVYLPRITREALAPGEFAGQRGWWPR